jgi:hypothetical protein
MGLRDKFYAKMASLGIDHDAVLAEQLGPEDPLVTTGGMTPSAYERAGGQGGMNVGGRLMAKAIDGATNAVSKSRHLGGDEGSIARSLPLSGDLMIGALSSRGLSLWDFGVNGQQTPPSLLLRIPGDQVASVVDTGTKAQGGTFVVRFTFVDDSFIDYRVLPTRRAFVDALTERWPT